MGCWGFQERPVYPQLPSHNWDWNEKLTKGIDCTDPKTCIYHLDIWAGKSPQHCTITDNGDPATTHPWFGKSCTEVCHFLSTFLSIWSIQPSTFLPNHWKGQQWINLCLKQKNGFYLSWGWDYPKNFTVLTVDDQKNKIRAFFGYDRPNDGLPVVTYDDKVSFAQYY